MANRWSKDRSQRSISIGAAIPKSSPLENAGTTPGNSGQATGAGDEFVYIPNRGSGFQYPNQIAWDVIVGAGGMNALVVNLETSDDGVNWSTLDSNASTTGGRRVVSNTLVRMIRANIQTYTPTAGNVQITVGISD